MIKKKSIFRQCVLFFLGALSVVFAASASSFDIITVNTHSKTASVEVLRLQYRLLELDYFSYKATGTYGRMSSNSIKRFQEVNNLSADGRAGEETYNLLFSNKALRNPIPINVSIPFGPTSSQAKADFGELQDWSSHVDIVFVADTTYQMTDLNTGTTLNIRRVGGTNHAKIVPETSADTEKFLQLFGGEFNWSKRPVTVHIAEKEYAASVQGMPYGTEKIDTNNMDGSCDLYFQNSLSDTSGLPDEEHRENVSRASGRW